MTAVAVDPVLADLGPPPKLQALIAAREAAYAEFCRVVHRTGSSRDDRERADCVEQEGLLAICSYFGPCQDKRRAKAKYLLAVEARGELDLEEHMQAILHSML